MAKRPKVDFKSVENLLLFRLQLALAKKDNIDNRPEALANELKQPEQLVRICAQRLEDNGYCAITKIERWAEHPFTNKFEKYDDEHLEIKSPGIEEVQSWPEEKYQQVAMQSLLPRSEWEISDVEESNERDKNGIPGSDRYVERSDNQEAWDKAVDALDNVISEADKTNDFGDLSDAEVEHAKEILRTGRKLFDHAKVRVEALATSLLPTLNWLKTHLSGMAVGTASGVAALAIGKLLGLL